MADENVNQDPSPGGGDEGGKDEEAKLTKLTGDDGVVEVNAKQLTEFAQKGKFVLPKTQSELAAAKGRVAELERTGAGSLEFVKDFKTLMVDEKATEDQQKDAAYRIGDALGWSRERVEQEILGGGEEPDGEPKGEDAEKPASSTVPAEREPVGLEHLDPKLRRMLEQQERSRLEGLRSLLFSQVDTSLAADPELGKLKGTNSRAFEVIADLGRKALQRRVVQEGQEPGPQLFAELTKEVKEIVDKLGIPVGGQADAKTLAAMGLGPIAESLGDSLHQEQPPKRVPVTDGDYRTNFAKRLAHRIRVSGGIAPREE